MSYHDKTTILDWLKLNRTGLDGRVVRALLTIHHKGTIYVRDVTEEDFKSFQYVGDKSWKVFLTLRDSFYHKIKPKQLPSVSIVNKTH